MTSLNFNLHILVWPKLWASGSIIEPHPPNFAYGYGFGPGYGATYTYPYGDGHWYGDQEGNGIGAGIDVQGWRR